MTSVNQTGPPSAKSWRLPAEEQQVDGRHIMMGGDYEPVYGKYALDLEISGVVELGEEAVGIPALVHLEWSKDGDPDLADYKSWN